MSIRENILKIKNSLPQHVRLIVVSKTQTADSILEAYNAGQRAFGENRMQELIEKAPLLPADIEWHFIGHLQTNKVKSIVPFVKYIQSVDSLKLLGEINKEALKSGRIINCLLEFYIATETSKTGFTFTDAEIILKSADYAAMKNIRICGVMGMASFTNDVVQIKKEFSDLRGYFNYLKENYFSNRESFCEISMGMSGDYEIAIEEGSTMIRIGTSIFSE